MELHDVRRTRFIQAHSSALACIALSGAGRLLATASEKGTLVRVWSTADGSKLQVCNVGCMIYDVYVAAVVVTTIDRSPIISIDACSSAKRTTIPSPHPTTPQELRRGADPACIYSLAFSKETAPNFLAVSSDKKTVHVFSLVGGEHHQRHQQAGGGEEDAGGGVGHKASPGGGGGWRAYLGVCGVCEATTSVSQPLTHQSISHTVGVARVTLCIRALLCTVSIA